jgi:hypothetical protein
MTDTQKTVCSTAVKITLSAAAGALIMAFTIGTTFGQERSLFRETAHRLPVIEGRVTRIELQTAEDRIVARHMLELLNEVRNDVRAIRNKSESTR